MIKRENINLTPLKFVSLFLITMGLCLYYTNSSSPIGAARSYFLLGFTVLFLIFGISFLNYEYTGYKRYFLDCVLKFFIFAAAYSAICCIVIIISVLTAKNNYSFLNNAITVVNNTKFLFTNFWFIPTGLIILLTLPFLDKLIKKFNYSIVLFMAVILAIALNEIIAPFIQNNGLHLRDIFSSLRYILFYGLITLTGLAHNKLTESREKNKIITLAFIFICLVLIAACLIIYGYSYDLIKHFYPPTFFLTVYHLLILAVFYAIGSRLNLVSSFLCNKSFVKYTSGLFLKIVFALPIFLYFLSLLFNELKITDFLSNHFILGFLTYLLCTILILALLFLIMNFFINRKKSRQLHA